jgi:hypothetical protein
LGSPLFVKLLLLHFANSCFQVFVSKISSEFVWLLLFLQSASWFFVFFSFSSALFAISSFKLLFCFVFGGGAASFVVVG